MIAATARGISLRSLLLLIVLFLGQTAMLAHAAEHIDAPPATEACLVCLAGQNLDHGAPPPAAQPRLDVFSHACPASALPASCPAFLSFRQLARGPPAA